MRLTARNILMLAITTTFLFIACRTRYPVATHQFAAARHTNSLENGKNLAYNICAGCHYDEKTMKFSGRPLNYVPKIAGKVYASNLTHSKSHGVIHNYTDAQIAYLLKTGIGHDGKFIPYMLRPNLADEDINDLIVYLRSDDPAVSAENSSPGQTHLNFLGKMGMSMLVKPRPYRENVPRPDPAAQIQYGAYLVDNIGCYHCHSRKGMSVNYGNPPDTKGYMAGGAKFKTDKGKIRGANLTFDKETGIGNYTKEAFRTALQQAIDENGRKLMPPMHPFPMLTDQQSDAIYVYLKSLPPKKNKVN